MSVHLYVITGGGPPIVVASDDVDRVVAEREAAGESCAVTPLGRGTGIGSPPSTL